jgi:hypothetical protein
MLEQYFVKPETLDRIRATSWIGAEIESYVCWLADHGYGTKSVWRRVPILFAFGEFAHERGTRAVADLPAYVEPFVADRVARHDARTGSARPMAKEVRGPVEQMLSLVCCLTMSPPAAVIARSRSPTSFRGSSTTWSTNAVSARSR